MRRIAILAALLVLLGGGAWFAFRGAGREPSTSDSAGRERPAANAPAALPEGGTSPDTRLAPAPGAAEPRPTDAPSDGSPDEAVEMQAPPDDPVEEGPATLALTVLDDETGAPQTGTVVLWRLDAPGNLHWRDGDQMQGNVRILEGHGERPELPEGRYRAVFEEQRGVAEREAEVRSSGRGYTGLNPRPAWVRARELRKPPRQELFQGRGGGGASSTSRSWRRVVAVDDVLPVGEFLEPSRGRRERVWLRVRTEGRNEVNVTLGDGAAGPTTHLAVALPLATLLDRLVLPDGTPVFGSAAPVEVKCEAELLTPETPPDRWRTLPVHISVQADGFVPLQVEADATRPSPPTPPWVRIGEKPPDAPR